MGYGGTILIPRSPHGEMYYNMETEKQTETVHTGLPFVRRRRNKIIVL
jgi:hypothetical protein